MQKYHLRRNQLQVTWTVERSTALCSIKTKVTTKTVSLYQKMASGNQEH